MTLDNPALAGRLKSFSRRSTYERRAVVPTRSRFMNDVRPQKAPVLAKSTAKPKLVISRQVAASPTPRISKSHVLKREVVTSTPVRRKVRRRGGGKVLTALAIILFIFGLGVGVYGLRQDQKVAAQVQDISNKVDAASDDDVQTGDVPSENEPTDVNTYKVAPTLPRKLSIDKLGVSARVLRLGVTTDNQFKSPANIHDTGWFEGSAKPGELGAVLIDGHVHGPTKPGVFFDLKKLQKNDKIAIERGDGKVFSYSVVTSKIYDVANVDMGAALSSITPGKPGLNLITCIGPLDASGTQYTQRLIVFAVQD